jgi:hypothetical protein
MNEKARFAQAITILARTFRQEVDEFLVEGYRMGLDGVPIDKIEAAVKHCCGSSKFMPSPVELKEAAGIRDVLALYRRVRNGKCNGDCDCTLSEPYSIRRGYCSKCWRGILAANGFTIDDEKAALSIAHGKPQEDKPKALPRSGGSNLRITGSDFDV